MANFTSLGFVLAESKNLDAMSSPAVRICKMRVYEESFEESRCSFWLDKNKALAAFSIPPGSKEPLALEAKEGSVAEPVTFEIGGEVEKKGEEGVGRKTVRVVKRMIRKFPVRVQKEENDGVGNEAQIESPKQIVLLNCDMVTEVNTNNASEGDMKMTVGGEKVVTKGTERVAMEEIDGACGKLGVNKEADIERAENIVSDSIKFRLPKCDISNDVNAYDTSEESKTGAVREKVTTNRSKRIKRESSYGDLGGVGVSNDAEVIETSTIEFRKPGSHNAKSSAGYDFDANIDTNAGKEEKTQRVVRSKVLTKGSKSSQKEDCSDELGKVEVDNEASTKAPNIRVLGAKKFQNSNYDIVSSGGSVSAVTDCDASGLMVVKNVNTNAADDEKTRIVRKKIVKVVKKKVVTKGSKRMKKKQTDEELGEVEVLCKAKLKSTNAIEFTNMDSNITKSHASDLLGVKPHGFNVVETVDTEKTSPFRDASGKVNANDSKKVNNSGIDSSLEYIKYPDGAEGEGNNCVNASLTEAPDNNQMDCENNAANDDKEIVSASENMGSDGNSGDGMEVEKVSSEGIRNMVGAKHEAESCYVSDVKSNANMADDLVLNEEMEALERRMMWRTEIFIGGLDKNAMEEDVRQVFQQVGEIAEVTVKMHEKTGKNKGFAFVRYASAADAKKALKELDKVEICGKQCSISFVKGNDTIFLGNIDKTWKNEDIVKLLQDVGVRKINKVTVKPDPENPKRNRGFAFLEIQTIRDARVAFGLLENKCFLGNQKIRVEWANEADKEDMHKVKTVYAEYLPISWDEEKVKDHFKKFGEIESVVLARNLVSSVRKDFAFVNYKTREAALKCIKEFSQESLQYKGSKEHVNVSLAKSTPKAKKVKHAPTPAIMISNKKKEALESFIQPNGHISKEKSIMRCHDYNRVVVHPNQLRGNRELTSNHCKNFQDRASTNGELIQLLREQASWGQPQTGLAIGPADLNYTESLTTKKRRSSHLEEDPIYSDPRRYPRPRNESAFSAVNPSRLSPGLGVQSLSHYYQQGLSYPSDKRRVSYRER